MPPLILASTSVYRQALLEKLGLPFIAISPVFEEASIPNESPIQKARRLAEGKARSLAERFPNHLIIGSDQVAHLPPDQILSKPGNFANARQQLLACSGKTVEFYTGLCVLNSATSTAQTEVDEFRVHFRALSETQIQSYLHREQPYDCAGSFKSEGLGIALFNALEGRDPNSLIGLPLILLTDLLQQQGVSVL